MSSSQENGHEMDYEKGQEMDLDWLVFVSPPRKPDFVVPLGSVDSHCHVFGPSREFPFSPERKYTPCDAGKDSLFKLRDHLGFSRNVIVQATCHGVDNRALVDACRSSSGLARGVASVRPDVTDLELHEMDVAGVRGVRFNFVKRLVGSVSLDDYRSVASRIVSLGWHIVVYFESSDLIDLESFLLDLPTLVIVDHMGRPDISRGVEHSDFRRFVNLLERSENIWTKVTCPERLSLTGPPYDDVVPFCVRLIELFPDRVLWGTDWPHPNMRSHMPDDGDLVDFIPRIAQTESSRHSLLVDNPMRLYWS